MLATTVPFQTMIEGRSQVLAYGVTIDLPSSDALYPGGALFPGGSVFPGGSSVASEDVSIAVTRLEIDASIDTDMPEGTRLEEGFSAVQGTFTLAGRVDASDVSKTAAWLFGRYSPPALSDGAVSPLARTDVLYREVTISLGLFPEGSGGTPELLTKLVGLVEDYGLDGDGNVSFTVIDLRQSFRGSVDLPAVVTVPPYNAGLTNEFVVDRILRQVSGGAISSWPTIRPSCVLAVGLRSSLWPEVGTLVENRGDFIFSPGVNGTALQQNLQLPIFSTPGGSTYSFSSISGEDLFFEFFIKSDPALPAATATTFQFVDALTSPNRQIKVGVSPFVVQIWADADAILAGAVNTTISLTGSGGTFRGYVGVHINWPAGAVWSATIFANGTTHTTGPQTAPGGARTSDPIKYLNLSVYNETTEAVQVTSESSPASNYPFTPRAVLDPSLNLLDVVPAISGDPWQTIQSLAASELAVAGFEGDTFKYRNRDTLRTSASVRSITSDQALNKIEESSSAAAIVNRAQVGYTPWTFAATATTLWTAPKAHKVPAHGTWSTTVTIDGLAAQVDTTLSVLPLNSTDATHSYYRVSNDKAGTSTHAPISVTVAQSSGSKFTITATNTSSTDAWLVSSAEYVDATLIPAGTPCLRIAGLLVTAGDEQAQDYQWPLVGDGGAASSRFGEIAYQQSGNPWLQDEDTADDLAADIVTGSYVPRPDLVNVDIDPDPRLERCDRVHLIDTARTGVDEYALIFGYGITYEAGDPPTFSMTIDARTITAPGGWILGVTGRSRLGVSTHLP